MPEETCCTRFLRKAMSTSVDDLRNPLFWRACVGECLGTLFLTLVGCGSCIGWDDSTPTVVQIALAFGLSVATMVWCLADSSGGHINPAVTMGMLVTRKISVARTGFYILSQCGGAIVGAGILRGMTPFERVGALGQTLLNTGMTPAQGFAVEFMITIVLVFTVFSTCDGTRDDLKGSGPLAIGLSVTMCHLFAVKFTGSSMNPARSFGPAVINGNWKDHWVYWIGPLLGGAVAAILYEYVFAGDATLSRAKGYLLASTGTNSDKTPRTIDHQRKDDIEVVEEKTSTV
ncbi:aquaporin AQPAn.G-like [Lineus longissimus]|uniref:aquaporin AQPAn.G-like n=1 Tax=Lineus longissimus TaxID=88925 RepID=UPI002B4D0FE5